MQRKADGELTVVVSDDFYAFFVGDTPKQDDAFSAIFGSPRLRGERLARLGPREEVARKLVRLPQPILVGPSEEYDFVAVVEVDGRTASAPFSRVRTPTHTGWVHDGGFSITISKPRPEDDHFVHDLEAVIDPDEDLDLMQHPDLWEFLELSEPDAVLHPLEEPNPRLPADYVNGLDRAHFFAACLRKAEPLLSGMALPPLRAALDDESLNTLAFLAEIGTGRDLFAGFGFVVESLERADERYEECDELSAVPVIANLDNVGLIVWFEAEMKLLTNSADAVRGVKLVRGSATS